MNAHLALFLMLFCSCHPVWSNRLQPLDSGQGSKHYHVKLTTRLSSLGLFSYSGRIISDYPALDFNFNYERKTWGFMLFKAFDLIDHFSDNNFALGLLYKNVQLGNRLTITPYAGFVLEQTRKIAGQGSDAVVIINAAYKLSKNLSVENSSLFSNLALESNAFDWVNRVRAVYSRRHVDLSLIAWHNNCVFDKTHYFSSGLSVMVARVKVSKKVFFNAGVTGVIMLETSDAVLFPKRNGVVFTVAGVLH